MQRQRRQEDRARLRCPFSSRDRNSHHTTYISIPIIINNISRSSIVQGLIASVSMRLGLSIELAQGGTASK